MIIEKMHGPVRTLAFVMIVLLACGATLLRTGAKEGPLVSSARQTPSATENPELVRRYQENITPEGLASHLYFLASDAFEGRETGTRGQKMAAAYLSAQYRRLGLAPKGTVKTTDPLSLSAYFQPFKLYRRAAKSSSLELFLNGERALKTDYSEASQDDLAYFAFGRMNGQKAGVVFAGYGIRDDELGYNDYAALKEKGLSVDGKWVMIFADEPLGDASTSLLPTKDRKPSKWSNSVYTKKTALWLSGKPAGLLIVSDLSPRAPKGGFTEQARLAAQAARGLSGLSLSPESTLAFPSTYMISTKLANRILSVSDRTVTDLKAEINGELKPVVFDVKGAEVNASAQSFEPVETENVLAYIEGSDPKLKDEVVVISAHYDHLGMNPQAEGDQIYNGAADDGSGTVAALAIAEGFMRAKAEGNGPRRSILFLNTAGEEKGTLGSAFYTDTQPVVPLEKIAALVNMDGIGGEDAAHAKTNPNYIYIIGPKELSGELMETARRLNELTGTKLLLDDTQDFPSDQRNFQKMFVPFIYYSTGLTEHYHKVSDEPQTINYEHMARVARLAFASAWQIANAAQAPSRLKRDAFTIESYKCPPCRLECDQLEFDSPGACPVCDMALAPKYKVKG